MLCEVIMLGLAARIKLEGDLLPCALAACLGSQIKLVP